MSPTAKYRCECTSTEEDYQQCCHIVERAVSDNAHVNGVCPQGAVLALARVLGSFMVDTAPPGEEEAWYAALMEEVKVGRAHAEKQIQSGEQRVDN